MILTLIIVWAFFSVLFFGSLAMAASVPMPAISQEDLENDAALRVYDVQVVSDVDAVYGASAATASKSIAG